jgi:uncharacterized membrane protein YfcA
LPGLAQLLVVVALSGVGAFVQGATGLGYGLVVAPGLFAVLDARQALYATLCSALVLNGLMLVGRRPVVRWQATGVALAWAVPGFVAGAAVVGRISRPHLQVAVGIAVVAAVLARAWHPGVIADGPRRSVARMVAGLTAGLLTTTISSNGPPLALWLDAEGVRGREMRDTLQVLFAGFNLAGVAALAFHELPRPSTVAVWALLLPGLVVGLIAGRRLEPRLAPATARRLALAVICATGAGSVLAGLL